MAENTNLVEGNEKSTPYEKLNRLELELIKLINKAETNNQLTDQVLVGLLKEVLVYDTKDPKGIVHGIYAELERLNEPMSAITGLELADKLVGIDMVTEVGIWERSKNGDKEIEYILRDGELSISEHGKRPSIMQPTDAVISDIGRIKQPIQAKLEIPATVTK